MFSTHTPVQSHPAGHSKSVRLDAQSVLVTKAVQQLGPASGKLWQPEARCHLPLAWYKK